MGPSPYPDCGAPLSTSGASLVICSPIVPVLSRCVIAWVGKHKTGNSALSSLCALARLGLIVFCTGTGCSRSLCVYTVIIIIIVPVLLFTCFVALLYYILYMHAF